MSKIQEMLRKEGLAAPETPEAKQAREKLESEKKQQQQQQQQSQQESPEEKEAREKKEKLQQQQSQQESPEEKEAREKKEKLQQQQSQQETPQEKEEREKREKLQQQQQQSQEEDIDDAKLLAQINKKRGTNFTSLDDINKPAPPALTDEEKLKAEEDRKNKVRQFALQSKKVTSTEFDNYVKETSVPVKDMAYNLYKIDRIEALKKKGTPADQIPEEKDLREEFDQLNFQYAAEDDVKRVRAEQRMNKEVDEYIESKYANILDLDDEYTSHEEETTQKQVYKGVVTTAIKGLGEEMAFEIAVDKDKIPFKFKITADVVKTLEKTYLNDNSFALFGKGKVNEKILQDAIRGHIIQQEFPAMLAEFATTYASAILDGSAKGRRGIIPHRKEEGSEGGEKKVNKVIQAQLQNADNKKILQQT